MQATDKTAKELFLELRTNQQREPFGYGTRPALINVDLQKAYTCVGEYGSAYEANPLQLDYVNQLARTFREKGWPVVWTYVAYMESGNDCGIWNLRKGTMDSLAGIKVGSRRAEFDDRLEVDHTRDIIVNKRMASVFFETNLGSLFTFHRVDTVVVTGGSTSGCVRATVVDSLSRAFRTIVPEECVADRHEGPHYASLYDIAMKYGDVNPFGDVIRRLQSIPPARSLGSRCSGRGEKTWTSD